MKTVYTILISLFLFTGCVSNDNIRFKDEYETISSTINNSVNIKYLDYSSLKQIIKQKALIYIGSPNDPWCLDIVPILFEMAGGAGLKTIYYYDINSIDASSKSEITSLINKTEITIPTLIFIKNNKVDNVISLSGNYQKLTERETEELKNEIYNNISNIIADKCIENTDC